jgi:shikimate dehydrogenase
MDSYAVIGNPVEHSLSPLIHQEFAKQTKQEMEYLKIEAPLNEFKKIIQQFIEQGGKGANVTLPFKEEAYALADEATDYAKQAKAANALLFENNHKIIANNFDGMGLIADLTNNHHYSLRQKRVLLLGAGGAARGIIMPLLEQAPSLLTIANRTKDKAIQLADEFQYQGEIKGIGLDELNNDPYDLIINSTSAGLTGNALQLPNTIITEQSWCYDIMYGKQGTPFLDWAQPHQPAKCLDGLGMLVEQAAASFYWWRGVYPETKPVLELTRHIFATEAHCK